MAALAAIRVFPVKQPGGGMAVRRRSAAQCRFLDPLAKLAMTTTSVFPLAGPTIPDVPSRIETARLVIRAPRAGDGAAVYEGVCETLTDLRAWPASLPWAMTEPSPALSEAFCCRGAAGWQSRSDFPMLMFLKDGNRYVGATGLHRVDWSVPRMEIGYWCRRGFRGQGLVAEAVRAVVEVACAKLGARRLTCLSDVANLPSRRVAERAGFVLEGVMRHERVTPSGELRDTCLYAIAR